MCKGLSRKCLSRGRTVPGVALRHLGLISEDGPRQYNSYKSKDFRVSEAAEGVAPGVGRASFFAWQGAWLASRVATAKVQLRVPAGKNLRDRAEKHA
jgi:hypothetical protein